MGNSLFRTLIPKRHPAEIFAIMAKKSYDLLFKLLLIGDSGVGKTWQVANSLVVMVVEVLKSAKFKA